MSTRLRISLISGNSRPCNPAILALSVRHSVPRATGDNVELHGLGPSINCLGRRVASCTTRDAKEIAKPLAMVP